MYIVLVNFFIIQKTIMQMQIRNKIENTKNFYVILILIFYFRFIYLLITLYTNLLVKDNYILLNKLLLIPRLVIL